MTELDFDPLDEMFRWCVYCRADCWPDEPDHADSCPFVTGRFPVTHPAEKGHPPGMCCRCDAPFQPDAFYHEVKVDDSEIPTYEVVCEDCALAYMTSAEQPRNTEGGENG